MYSVLHHEGEDPVAVGRWMPVAESIAQEGITSKDPALVATILAQLRRECRPAPSVAPSTCTTPPSAGSSRPSNRGPADDSRVAVGPCRVLRLTNDPPCFGGETVAAIRSVQLPTVTDWPFMCKRVSTVP